MKYKIDWMQNDKYGNITASVTREDNTKLLEVILGKEFKDKGIMPGHEIQGKEWVSPKNGKMYLFEEKEGSTGQNKPSGGYKTQQIEKAMDRKEGSIEKFQDSKEQSIKLAGAQRDAVLIVTTMREMGELSENDIKEEIIKWRNWFLNDKEFNNPPPFND